MPNLPQKRPNQQLEQCHVKFNLTKGSIVNNHCLYKCQGHQGKGPLLPLISTCSRLQCAPLHHRAPSSPSPSVIQNYQFQNNGLGNLLSQIFMYLSIYVHKFFVQLNVYVEDEVRTSMAALHFGEIEGRRTTFPSDLASGLGVGIYILAVMKS